MRRSIMIVGVFFTVALASSTALGLAMRDRAPLGVEHRLVAPIVVVADGEERINMSEAIPPKRVVASYPAPSMTPVPEELALPVRDIAKMICTPHTLAAGTVGSSVMICD
jgi:hypothetical protein